MHPDEDDFLCRARSLQILLEPDQLLDAKPFASPADIVQSDEVNVALEIRGVGHLIVEQREIHRYLDESLFECFHSVAALGLGAPEKSKTLDLVVPHHGIEGNSAKVVELPQEQLVLRRGKFQIAQEKERLGTPPPGFFKRPRHNSRAVIPGVATDGEADRALRRLLGK